MKISYYKHLLKFNFEAGTSRGILTERYTYIIRIEKDGIIGWGEASPLKGLSIDFIPNFENHLTEVLNRVKKMSHPTSLQEVDSLLDNLKLDSLPAIRFGLEQAMISILAEGNFNYFNCPFIDGNKIPINGLIWMGKKGFMLDQAKTKFDSNFNCIKMKVGAIDRRDELEVLNYLRSLGSEKELTIRIDANGAFSTENVLDRLEEYSQFNIHSIEQPIKSGDWKSMSQVCKNSPIPVALDEELIGISSKDQKEELLDQIAPPYIILKPTLLGGFKHTSEWIELAEQRNIRWWITSALESNIGLNAICQYSSWKKVSMPQGLGTGSLYHNNFDSPLTVNQGHIHYDQSKNWTNIEQFIKN